VGLFDRFAESDLFGLALAPPPQLDAAFFQGLRPNRHTQWNSYQIGVFEFHPWSLVPIVEQNVDADFL
jgi:hypothetical protein